MANASAKKQAASNADALKTLHLTSLGINVIVLLSHFVFGRPDSIKLYLMFTTFALFLQFQLERMGRPKYDYSRVKSGSASAPTLVSPGDDLQSEGLVEWIHDAIYMTWICDILSVVFSSSKVWFLYLAIPAYATFKIYKIFIAGKGMLGGSSNKGAVNAAPDQSSTELSKRQEKLQKKRQKYGM